MLRHLLATCLALTCLDALAGDLDAILERNALAHGGAEAFARIENVRFELTIREPGFEVNGTYVATREGSMRIDIRAGGQTVFSEGLHLGFAWQWTPEGGIEAQDGVAAGALSHGIDLPGRFFTMEQVRERGARITLVGEVSDDDGTQWQLRVVLPDGFSRDYFIDPASGRTVRERDFRAFHPAIDPSRHTVETRYEGDLWVDGVLRNERSTSINVDNGDWLGTSTVTSVHHNVEIPEDYFDPSSGTQAAYRLE